MFDWNDEEVTLLALFSKFFLALSSRAGASVLLQECEMGLFLWCFHGGGMEKITGYSLECLVFSTTLATFLH